MECFNRVESEIRNKIVEIMTGNCHEVNIKNRRGIENDIHTT